MCVISLSDNTKQLSDPARWETNSRSWRYQTCAQVSYFNTAPPRGSLRAESVNLEYHLAQVSFLCVYVCCVCVVVFVCVCVCLCV